MQPTMSSALLAQIREVGQDEVDAQHVGSGNISPQSSSMMAPSTSMQAQLRPISPRPPRKVIVTGGSCGRQPFRSSWWQGGRTGLGSTASSACRGVSGTRRRWTWSARLEAVGSPEADGTHRRASRGRAAWPWWGSGSRQVAVHVVVALGQPGIDSAGLGDVTLGEAAIISAITGADQWVATPMTPTAPTASSDRVSGSSPL